MTDPKEMDDKKFRAWKFYQERADTIKERLWSRMTWVLALHGAILAFITNEKIQIIKLPENTLFSVQKTASAIGIGWFGILLSFTTILIFFDGMNHIRSNWDRAIDVEGGTAPSKSMRDFYKRHVKTRIPLHLTFVVNIIAFVGYLILISCS